VGYEPELFDLRSDPGQTTNLAQKPPRAGTLALFEAKLRQQLDPEGMDRLAKADQDQLIARFGGREAALKIGTPGASPVPKSR
jgi:choline-sulfatase